jgi:hypothetical protein
MTKDISHYTTLAIHMKHSTATTLIKPQAVIDSSFGKSYSLRSDMKLVIKTPTVRWYRKLAVKAILAMTVVVARFPP